MRVPVLPVDYWYSGAGQNGTSGRLSSLSGAPVDMHARAETPSSHRSGSNMTSGSFAASAVSPAGEIGAGSKLAAPCVCYQAKEKEPLADTLRRAGKRCASPFAPPSSSALFAGSDLRPPFVYRQPRTSLTLGSECTHDKQPGDLTHPRTERAGPWVAGCPAPVPWRSRSSASCGCARQ